MKVLQGRCRHRQTSISRKNNKVSKYLIGLMTEGTLKPQNLLFYARPFLAATAVSLPATSHGRFGRSTAGLSRS